MKRNLQRLLLTVSFVMLTMVLNAQSSITGKVVDEDGIGLPGASVYVKGTQYGTTTDLDGVFSLNVKEGTLLVISFVGYESIETKATDNLSVSMNPGTSILAEITVTSNVIDVVKGRETPVAVSSISPQEISMKTGNLEFPEIMNRTPGVYATKQGGGYGDSRISLRGFDQSNTSFLINGQPVNDMENGWVYWSNWQGLTDVASGIQIQRGLGASRLAVPSVGGTVSIFTKAAEMETNGKVSQLIGNDGYSKTTASYSTGLNDDGWAASVLISYWKGDGYVYNTAGEGYTYFGAIGYEPVGSNHAFNFSFLGAGQWHNQRDVWVSIRDYQNFGSDHKDGIDRRWNTNGGLWDGEEFNMRKNFYNKPLATVNWDWEITENLSLATSLYGSWGRGGGTGPRGNNYRNSVLDILPFEKDLTEHYLEDGRGARNAKGFIDFDQIIATNRSTTLPYNGTINSGYEGALIGSNGFREDSVNRATIIRRSSMNSHNWFGGISTLDYESGDFRYSLGIDLRKYTGYHYRVVNNLMGLDGYYSTGNSNSAGQIIETTVDAQPFSNTGINGPKIDYYNLGYVDWQGLNGLVEYSNGKVTGVVQGGVSNQAFQREDFFDQVGNPLSKKKSVLGGYVKGGANYNINSKMNAFFNAGYISRQPLFDAVFPNFANDVNPDLQNELITSFEVGYGYYGRYFTLSFNAYSTAWGNRFISRSYDVTLGDGSAVEGTAQFDDIDVLHQGVELEATYRPIDNLKLRGMFSLGDWRYANDFDAKIFDDSRNEIGSATLYMKDVKVGDAAQLTSYVSADYTFKFLSLDLGYRYVDELYADYDITEESEFTTPNNRGALELPSYGLLDAGITARFKVIEGINGTFRVNVNNVFDTVYIAESNTNIHTEDTSVTWEGVDVTNYVWFGFGRTWNAALSFTF